MENKNNIFKQFHSDEFGNLEILFIDGKPYFPATECAKLLGYNQPEHAIKRHCKGCTFHTFLTAGGNQQKKYIPEGDLYRLIIRSKLPAAERFESWVFDTVLPNIRRHGAYIADELLDKYEKSQEAAAELFGKLMAEKNKTFALTELTEKIAPKAIYCDLVLKSKNAIPVSLIAKDYGMSAAAFNNLLHKLQIQYKTGRAWLPYQTYSGKGYTKTLTYMVDDAVCAMHTYWTQKGRLFIYEFLKSCGILPLAEKYAGVN